MIVERGPGAPRWAYLLRDETLHTLYSYLEENRSWHGNEPRFHELSHGEAFLSIFSSRATRPGLYLLDEPDAALSFTATLSLLAALKDLAADSAQVVIATHSPVLAALPGAHLLEVGPWGIRPAAWDELELIAHWRQFLLAPQSFLRHLD